ncbi:T9SS type A sorting domain-containing protein [Pontibacter russatus]|uniref:T9SS type A sorting domain-containing protein n=1 Tax=Pontibacter russatus TaxID=2694929 RepID=UPI00137ACAB9|nr:T9SS type A sorting domain-containing protein [Pontibacter russatus]
MNRAIFTTAPDVVVYTYENTTIEILGFEFTVRIPTEVVDLQARLDSDEPCLEITPLPVELITFDAAATDKGIELSWSTASEQNNSHFLVERSADGMAFEQVGKVDGHGNSSAKISYSYTDFSPLPGQAYYRLKQVDFDGQYEYSKIIAVAAAASGTEALQVMLAPNPCPNGNCQISIRNANGAQETRLELSDLSGRVIYTTTVQHANNANITLPLQELQAYKGLYMLSAISGNNVVRQRVVLE